jgi:hypothetical protein
MDAFVASFQASKLPWQAEFNNLSFTHIVDILLELGCRVAQRVDGWNFLVWFWEARRMWHTIINVCKYVTYTPFVTFIMELDMD